MNWLTNTLGTSIGKKLMMAITGLCFCGFLVVHLIGNLTIYGGKEMFLSYVDHLHALGKLITVAEWGLVILALIHILTGLTLFYQNLQSRPVNYQVKKAAGGRTIGSATMPYSGILILLFVLLHLFTFRFVDKTNINDFIILTQTFVSFAFVLIYIIAVVIVAIHVSHGFWSGFQTLGLNHAKYMPIIMGLGIVFSIVVGVGFGFIPIYVSLIA
ncbi:MAG: succinate dehydrogenase cytochrome b subunit [Desulfobacterales bacterium]|nr:succinate dehydrogenase cytochrome b subunit [Desulfobacterales bacterium]MDD4071639.1 succinate dehydrogenase cytochrome b subunit [Desulfobacterales bacterium]MDD4391639.1 succinate dehydrogenase cytochrome b subunit [Desulfobacterales bacterium]